MERAYDDGFAAFEQDYKESLGEIVSECPYDDLEKIEWFRGYNDAYEICKNFGGIA